MDNKGKQQTNTKTKAGYEYLLAYKVTVPIYDYSVVFADRWISKFSRTKDQWEQAARSGTQNIPEGYTQQSLAGYIKLTGVARGSLEELLKDCLAYARQNGLQVWSEEKCKREIREIGEIWEILRNNPYLPDNPNFPALPSDKERALNLLITLINQANTLIDRLIESLKEKHTREGGFNEKLLARRLAYRRRIPLISLILFFSSLIPLISLSFPSPVSAANSGIFTVSAWVRPETSVASKAIVGKSEELRVFTDGSGLVGCQIKSTTWQTAVQATTNALALNTWAHVACTYDKINLRAFVNGVQVGTPISLTATIDDTANPLKYGIDDSASTPYSVLKGRIDELKFYNYARTQKQIVEDMTAGHPAVSASGKTPIAYYKFDEGQGTVANNKGNGGSTLNGTFGTGSSAPTWTMNGKFGKALSFDGGDYLQITDSGANSPIDIGQPGLTVSAWINPNSITSGSHAIIAKNAPYILWIVNTGGNTRIDTYLYKNSTWYEAYGANNQINVGQWQHIVMTYDGVTRKIYYNGSQSGATDTQVSGNIDLFASHIQIGQSVNNFFYDGLIDEVKIYNYALTEDEVKVEYNRGSALVLGSLSTGTGNTAPNNAASQEYCIPGDLTSCAGPVARWDFNEGIGTTAMDTSGNGNTGTLGAGDSAPSWKTGKVGKGLKFDGVNDYVDVGTSSAFNSQYGTFEAWVKFSKADDDGSGNTMFYNVEKVYEDYFTIVRGSTGDGGGGAYIGKLVVFIEDGDVVKVARRSSILLNNTNWNHIAVTQDGTGIKLYINGVYDSAASGTDSAYWTSHLTSIGTYIGGKDPWGRWMEGPIDQVRIYNYARTPAQIAWDYNRGGPILHYRMDECEGTTIHSATKPLNASLNGTLTVGALGTQTQVGTCADGLSTSAWYNGRTGKINSSLNFDGTDDYVTVPENSSLDMPSAFTLSAWFKKSATSQQVLVTKEDTTNNRPNYAMDITNSMLRCFGYQSTAAKGITAGNTTLSSGVWYHGVCTFDGTNWTTYINGRKDKTLADAATLTTYDNGLTLGYRVGGHENIYTGQIDDVKIYNYALTSTQVKELYNGGAVKFGN